MVSNSAFFVLTLAALAAASPVPRQSSVTPTLPEHGGGTELPSPSNDLALKAILLGHGIQNYTCVADPSVPATATGALAILYEATKLYGTLPSVDDFEHLPVAASKLELPIDDPSSGHPFPDQPEAITVDGHRIEPVGRHYFDAGGNPTFNLGGLGFLSAAVRDRLPAPADASPGPDGQPAVPWLRLGAREGGGSRDVTVAYRVTTVGGTAPACSAAGSLSIPYATYYWFYGPK